VPEGFVTNAPGPQPSKASRFRRIPRPGGATPEEQSSVYSGFYGELPMPATQFATSVAALRSTEIQPSVRSSFSNASLVDRHNRRNGILSTAGRKLHKNPTPEYNKPVFSSEFQKSLIGPQVNYTINACWYAAGFPAATISFGTDRNLALSERVPQLPTRTTGGPGPAAMTPAPRFKSVQTVPRYSTMPSFYNTQATDG
jgi:hypothetical protein